LLIINIWYYMITKFILLVLLITFSNFVNSSDQPPEEGVSINIEELRAVQHAQGLNADRSSFSGSEDSAAIAHRTRINTQRVSEAHEILSDDYMDHLKDLRSTRWFFRKFANYTEGFANLLLPVGVGLETISSIMSLVGADSLANTVLFTGAACVVVGGSFLGIARYGAREQRERELLLKGLAKKVGFSIVDVPNTITSSDGGAENVILADHRGPISALTQPSQQLEQ
jgi:hypothetical protein